MASQLTGIYSLLDGYIFSLALLAAMQQMYTYTLRLSIDFKLVVYGITLLFQNNLFFCSSVF